MIVAIEGIDAAGKEKQASILLQRFAAHRGTRFTTVRKHDFPHYETTAGGVAGRILRGATIIVPTDAIEDMNNARAAGYTWSAFIKAAQKSWSRDKALIVQSMMMVDRLEWLPLLAEFAQSPDSLLVLDRYKMSGIVYGAADEIETSWTRTLQSCLPDADLNIFLDISVAESYKRKPNRDGYYEMSPDKLSRIRECYLSEFNQAAQLDPLANVIVTGMQSVTAISDVIESAILAQADRLYRDQNGTIVDENS
jgi:thymidylate kinase